MSQSLPCVTSLSSVLCSSTSQAIQVLKERGIKTLQITAYGALFLAHSMQRVPSSLFPLDTLPSRNCQLTVNLLAWNLRRQARLKLGRKISFAMHLWVTFCRCPSTPENHSRYVIVVFRCVFIFFILCFRRFLTRSISPTLHSTSCCVHLEVAFSTKLLWTPVHLLELFSLLSASVCFSPHFEWPYLSDFFI